MLRNQEDIFNMSLRVQNLLRLGHVNDTRLETGEVLVRFSADCCLWLKCLSLKTGLSFPLEKGETVLVVCPHGDLTDALVWGSLPAHGSKKGFEITTNDTVTLKAKSGLHLGNGKEELLKLIIEALKIISTSKTATPNGPQPSLESSTQLPQIILKLESICA